MTKISRSNSKMYIDLRIPKYITKTEALQRMVADGQQLGKGRKYLHELPVICDAGLDRMAGYCRAWKFFDAYFNEPNEKYLVIDIHSDYRAAVEKVDIRTFKAILRAYKADSGANIQFTNRKARQKAMRVERIQGRESCRPDLFHPFF